MRHGVLVRTMSRGSIKATLYATNQVRVSAYGKGYQCGMTGNEEVVNMQKQIFTH